MLTLYNAKNRFSAVVEAALASRPQAVSRCGKPAVVVVSAEEYHRLVKAAQASRESFTEHLLAFPCGEVERAKAGPRDAAVVTGNGVDFAPTGARIIDLF